MEARVVQQMVLDTTQGNLQIQCNPYQNTNFIFHWTETNNLKYFLETQKTPTSKNLRKKNIAGEIRKEFT